MFVQVTGADLFEALKNNNGEDVWYLVDEHFSNLGEANPYECPITFEMTIETEHFKEIVASVAKVKQVLGSGETQIIKPEVTQLAQSNYGVAVQQIVCASANEIHAFLAENAYALGISATEIYGAVLERTIVTGVGNATNTVLDRLANSLEEVSKDASQDFLDKYNLGLKIEIASNNNPAATLLTKRFNQFKSQHS